jgi:hypothetical protein
MARTVHDQTPGGAPPTQSNGHAREHDSATERRGTVQVTMPAANREMVEGTPLEPLLVTVEEAARLLRLGRSMV